MLRKQLLFIIFTFSLILISIKAAYESTNTLAHTPYVWDEFYERFQEVNVNIAIYDSKETIKKYIKFNPADGTACTTASDTSICGIVDLSPYTIFSNDIFIENKSTYFCIKNSKQTFGYLAFQTGTLTNPEYDQAKINNRSTTGCEDTTGTTYSRFILKPYRQNLSQFYITLSADPSYYLVMSSDKLVLKKYSDAPQIPEGGYTTSPATTVYFVWSINICEYVGPSGECFVTYKTSNLADLTNRKILIESTSYLEFPSPTSLKHQPVQFIIKATDDPRLTQGKYSTLDDTIDSPYEVTALHIFRVLTKDAGTGTSPSTYKLEWYYKTPAMAYLNYSWALNFLYCPTSYIPNNYVLVEESYSTHADYNGIAQTALGNNFFKIQQECAGDTECTNTQDYIHVKKNLETSTYYLDSSKDANSAGFFRILVEYFGA